MLKKNYMTGLTGIEMNLTNLVNVISVAFFQIISLKMSVAILLIHSKYRKNQIEMVVHPEMLRMLP